MCRRGKRRAYLYDPADLRLSVSRPQRQLDAVAKAVAARRWCPDCQRGIDCEFPLDRHVRPEQSYVSDVARRDRGKQTKTADLRVAS